MTWIEYFENAQRRLLDDRKTEASFRSVFQMDYDRIVFSSAFRRLQNKTQVLPFPHSDYVRNRLTHSLETASVGRTLGNIVGHGIVEKYPELEAHLNIKPTDFGHLVSAACLAHDIGNPPFGHSGEASISKFFKSDLGKELTVDLTDKQKADLQNFEGNASGLRILSKTLENQSAIKGGLRLTLGLYGTFLKYPKESLPNRKKEGKASLKKFGIYQSEIDLFETEIASKLHLIPQHTPEGKAWKRFPLSFLVEAADDICYHIIDFEDGFNLGYIPFKTIEGRFMSLVNKKYFSVDRYHQIYDEREKINYLRSLAINSLVEQVARIFIDNEQKIVSGEFDVPLLNFLPVIMQKNLEAIIAKSVEDIYQSDTVLRIEMAGMKVIPDLLGKFVQAVLYPDVHKQLFKLLPNRYKSGKDNYEKILNATMFISDMTDRQAVELYKNLNGIELAGY